MGGGTVLRLLLDSHVVLWWLAGGEWLSRRVRSAISAAEPILVSPVSLWEITLLATRGRIVLGDDPYIWAQSLLDKDGIEEAPLSPAAAVSAALLDPVQFPSDPADRLLYSTARDLDLAFVTRDRAIHDYARDAGDVRVIW